jgi:hypothetical protein
MAMKRTSGTQQEMAGRTNVVFDIDMTKRVFDTTTPGGPDLQRAHDGVWLVNKPGWLEKGRVPGYVGYVPGGRFAHGETYGLTTSHVKCSPAQYTKPEKYFCNDNVTIGNPKPRPESPWKRKAAMNARFNLNRSAPANGKKMPQSGLGATRVGEGKVPGYAGFIRGSQQVHARPFGNTTRRCENAKFRKCYELLANSDSLPAAPQCKASNVKQPNYKVPGYQGHVTGVRHDYAMTYAQMTTSKNNQEFKVPDRSFRCWENY